MIENTDAEQIERLNSRVAELLREQDALVKALQATQGQIMNAKIDLQTGHTKAAGLRTMDGIIKFVDSALASIKVQS